MGFVFFAIAVVFFLVFKAIQGANNGTYLSLLANGIPARGILLSVDSMSTRTTVGLYRYEQRAVVLDVEMPGQQPYVVNVRPIFPANFSRDVLPGATVELRIDRRDSTKIAIVGPGVAFNAAALLGPAGAPAMMPGLPPPMGPR